MVQKPLQVPRAAVRLLLSSLQILGCEGRQRQAMSLFTIADCTPHRLSYKDKRLISSHVSKAKLRPYMVVAFLLIESCDREPHLKKQRVTE